MLDRDELAARATSARAALLSLCEALSALVPVAPASGAPATEPRRTVGAVVRTGDCAEFVVVAPDRTRRIDLTPIRDPRLDGPPLYDTDAFVRWATREECERHSIPYVARPLPGAPLAAPSRPEWVPKVGERVRVLKDNANYADVKAGYEYVVTSLGSDPYPETEAWGCGTGGAQYVRVCNLEPCAAPSPAAKPWTWRAKPEVGDVWVHPLAPETQVIITTSGGGLTLSAGKNFAQGEFTSVGPASSDGAFGWYYLRRATSSERAAAGLPVDESAFDEAKEREAARVVVDRQGVRFGPYCWVSHDTIMRCDADTEAGREAFYRDRVIPKQYMAWVNATLAAERAVVGSDVTAPECNEAWERDAFHEWARTAVNPYDPLCAWIARARVAAKGGA